MRILTLDECASIAVDMFRTYTQEVAISLMKGEIPTIKLTIHRSGTKEKDWLAQVHFRNTPNISVFRCDIYFDDLFRLCRRCKLYLVDASVWRIVTLYGTLHPLLQSQLLYANRDRAAAGVATSMADAGKEAYRFIRTYYPFQNDVERVTLEILKRYMMVQTNHYYDGVPGRYPEMYLQYQYWYEDLMIELYPKAYQTARIRKAHTTMLDLDGFMVMERVTESSALHYDSRTGRYAEETSIEERNRLREREMELLAERRAIREAEGARISARMKDYHARRRETSQRKPIADTNYSSEGIGTTAELPTLDDPPA